MIFFTKSIKWSPFLRCLLPLWRLTYQKPGQKFRNQHVLDATLAIPNSNNPLTRLNESNNNLNQCNDPLDIIQPCILVIMIMDSTSSSATQMHVFIQNKVPAQEYVFLANLPPWIAGGKLWERRLFLQHGCYFQVPTWCKKSVPDIPRYGAWRLSDRCFLLQVWFTIPCH